MQTWIFVSGLLVTGILNSFAVHASERFDQIKFHASSQAFVTELRSGEAYNTSTEIYLAVFEEIGHTPKVELMPYARSELAMQGEDSICLFSRIKTEERQAYLFSKPLAAYLSPRLYQRRESKPVASEWLDEQQRIHSMSEMFNSGQYGSLLMIQERAYGDFLDPEIARIHSQYKSYRWGADSSSMDVRMLLKGRAEFILGYPANIYLEKKRLGGPQLRSYAIAGLPESVLAYTMCNDRPLSREYIQTLNQGLERLYQQPEFLQMHLKYIDESNQQELTNILIQHGMAPAPK